MMWKRPAPPSRSKIEVRFVSQLRSKLLSFFVSLFEASCAEALYEKKEPPAVEKAEPIPKMDSKLF